MTKTTKVNSIAEQKKNSSVIKKLVISIAVIILVYFGFKSFKTEPEIELSSEIISTSSSEISEINEPLEIETDKSPDFIYQTLLKNQIKLEDLRGEIEGLRAEVSKYQNHDKIGKMILGYVNLRDRFFAGKSYEKELMSFKLISSNDRALKIFSFGLKKYLSKFKTSEKLANDFISLVPDLIAIRNYGNSDDLLAKLRRNISKLVTIKRTDKIGNGDIDAVILKVGKALKEGKYQEALEALSSLESKYQIIIADFVASLQNRIDVEKADQAIISYLDKIS